MTDLIPDGVTRLLLVEGPDDKQFFKRLISHIEKDRKEPFDQSAYKIRKYRGKNRLGAYLFELLQQPNFDSVNRIWIVRDVDYNQTDSERKRGAPLRALDSVNTAIRNSYSESSRDIEPPQLQDFMTPSNSKPSLSLLSLPSSDITSEGSLETILLKALADDPMMYCVDNYFDCIKQKHPESEVARNREDKGRLNVLLSGKLVLRDLAGSKDATRELPRYMYNMKWWNMGTFDDQSFDDAKAFLKQLLDD